MKELVIDAPEVVEKIPVKLVGVKYSIRRPKSMLAMSFARRAKAAKEDPEKLMEAVEEWVRITFGKATGVKVIKRLNDPEDELDFEHIVKLMEAVIELTNGSDPTT